MKTLTLIICSIFLSSCYSSSEYMFKELHKKERDKRLKVAVIDLSNKTEDINNDIYAKSVTGFITDELQNTGQFRLIERQRINSVLDELKFQMEGMVDWEKAKQVGKMLEVDLLFIGNLASINYDEYGPSALIAYVDHQKVEVNLDARLVDVESGEVFSTAKSMAFVKQSKWTAFFIFSIGGLTEKQNLLNDALQKASKKLVNELASKS